MDASADMSWSRNTSDVAMVPDMSEDDFSNFFDFGSADLGLPEFETNGATDASLVTQQSGSQIEQNGSGFVDSGLQHYFDAAAQMSPIRQPQSISSHPISKRPQAFQQSPSNTSSYMSPIPTSSLNAARLYPASQHFERMQHAPVPQVFSSGGYQYGQVDPSTYTPMMTPEFTGVDSAVSFVPHYPLSDNYNLSPITSPAMQAQNRTNSFASSLSRTAESSLTASPIDNSNASGEHSGTADRPRKAPRKAPTPRSIGNTPNTRAKKAIPNITTRRRTASIAQSKTANSSTNGQSTPTEPVKALSGSDESTSRSISPRDGSSMAPPPKPITPAATPKARPLAPTQDQLNKTGLPPATPASIMRLQKAGEGLAADGTPKGNDLSPATSALDAQMEFLKLPEAAAPPVPEPVSHVSQPSSRKKIVPQSNSAVVSPTGPVGKDETETKTGRPPKKRGSSSNLVSPALRPKISPGLKPLLPDGSHISPQDHTLLLATRSNYQNLLEGTNPPGVTYSTDLSSGLSSKRTSHKLAEQGRRNRINTALQEMQTLLPPSFSTSVTKEGSADSPTANGAGADAAVNGANSIPQTSAQNGNSKAATVESAIEYIKHLQQDKAQRDAEHEALLKEVQRLKATKAQ